MRVHTFFRPPKFWPSNHCCRTRIPTGRICWIQFAARACSAPPFESKILKCTPCCICKFFPPRCPPRKCWFQSGETPKCCHNLQPLVILFISSQNKKMFVPVRLWIFLGAPGTESPADGKLSEIRVIFIMSFCISDQHKTCPSAEIEKSVSSLWFTSLHQRTWNQSQFLVFLYPLQVSDRFFQRRLFFKTYF